MSEYKALKQNTYETRTVGQVILRRQNMSIQVHFVNPNTEKDTTQMVSELLVLLALKKLHTVS